MHTLAPELLQVPDPQTPHEEAALAPVVATKVPDKQEVQPPLSVDVPAEALYLPITQTTNKRTKESEVSKRVISVKTTNKE